MALSPNGSMGEYLYTSATGTSFRVKLSQGVAIGGGWSATSNYNIADWGNRAGKNKVAGVYGKVNLLGFNHRAFLPCPSPAAAAAKFTAGSFSIGGQSYTVTGMRGEHRSLA